jgi:CheY-like chemotaxis protein
MREAHEGLSLLLVDNDPEFHRIARTLERMGLKVRSVSGPDAAEDELKKDRPDLLVLDIAAGGLQTLRKIQHAYGDLPAIVLASHSGTPKRIRDLDPAYVRFVSKPVNVDEFLAVLRKLTVETESVEHAVEHKVSDLMVSLDLYPKVYLHEPVSKIVEVLERGMFESGEEDVRTRLRSVLVYDREGAFVNIIRLNDLLEFLVPKGMDGPVLGLTGMFHARCQQLMNMPIKGLVKTEVISVDADAPLMEALFIMVKEHQINLPVMEDGELVGVIRDKDILIDLGGEIGLGR